MKIFLAFFRVYIICIRVCLPVHTHVHRYLQRSENGAGYSGLELQTAVSHGCDAEN